MIEEIVDPYDYFPKVIFRPFRGFIIFIEVVKSSLSFLKFLKFPPKLKKKNNKTLKKENSQVV